MSVMEPMQGLSSLDFGKEEFSPEVLNWIAQENIWNLWVPKSYGGLEMSLSEGLKKLRSLAKVDGSLGWTITLCSGANFFIGNLKQAVANEIFIDPEKPICFGGSGGVFGTAEKKGEGYVISGTWKYATGAPYLTHFTLNAKIREDGKDVLQKDGTPLVRSFVLKKEEVQMIKDWNTMGLKATATESFEVRSKWVHEKYSFVYNELHQPHSIFKIPFSVFADLTLWVNYIGMAAHFLEEALKISRQNPRVGKLQKVIQKADSLTMGYTGQIQRVIGMGSELPNTMTDEIHQKAKGSVRSLSDAIIRVYPTLGIAASKENHPLNQVLKDYFTATQHHIFR
ncbi:acyl-CoA dehydrogenase [Flagellimonas halotolerans]|uniref:Acyl-CoA dehydrogenase n=1 Tax=Flagellimonas halotolerans TaxID=3112164 RepID=A0ABU6IS66_9FLAO|nr:MULTISPECIES: acyl-CoA dehydrogenase [unclassified Allomuricauda]MEC3966099.1 acyl-CoA dehydrogenase [Muricauda sp. SYSU M86414]MEC4265964.1 acyl-CoA dehydrogenase [Muricauda sp. SYSU M84420]